MVLFGRVEVFCFFFIGGFLWLLVFLGNGDHHARPAAVTVDGTSLAAAAPSLYVELVDKFLIHLVRQVYRHGNGMVHPFLDGSLHTHFHQPVYIVGCRFIIG